jgi:hypothetical protein
VAGRLPTVESSWAGHEQLRAFVRYSLSQLRNRNEHHRFEHLCEALARQRITPNILVASGPVSSGGDQGRDFETFRGYTHGHVRDLGAEIGVRDSDTIVFCCTVGQDNVPRKIEDDIKKIASGESDVDLVVYFCEQDVPVATRHKIIEKTQTEHGVRLEILDGQTLTALLCDRDTFWIAVEFLDIPVHVAPEEPGPEWYASSRARWLARTAQASTGGDVIELSACVRFATFNEAFRGDVSLWLDRLAPLLRDDVDPVLRRRARYEIVVATYRGLGDLRPADELVRLALSDAALSSSAEELDSADILYQYAEAAWLNNATDLSADELHTFGEQLEQQLVRLLGSAAVPDRRCRLLALIGRVRLRPNLHSLAPRGAQRGRVKTPSPIARSDWEKWFCHVPAQRLAILDVVDSEGAMSAWSEVLAILKEAPLFPVQAFAETVAMRAPYLNKDPRWPGLVAQLDSHVVSAAGRQAAAGLARSRSTSLLAAGMPFAALNDLHQSRAALVMGDTRYEGAEALLDAASVYGELGLLYAAKHYALAAGAVSGNDDEQDHPIVASSLILAAHCDFLAGNWYSLMAWLPHALGSHTNLREAADEPGRWQDIAQLLGGVSVVAKFVHQLSDARLTNWLASKLAMVGADLDELAGKDVAVQLPGSANDVTVTSLTAQLGQAPFADTGPTRMIRFAVRGLRWRIRARNTFDDVRAAERLAAAVQVITAALGDDDLVLAEATVEVRVKTVRPRQGGAVVDRPPKPTGSASDGAHRWEAVLTRDLGPYSVNVHTATSEVVAIATAILLSMSLLPGDSIVSVLERVGRDGTLILAAFPHIRYDRAYAVLSLDDFAERERQALGSFGPGGFGEVLTAEYLAPVRGPGPTFRGETPAERVPGRYHAFANTLRITLPRLVRENSVQQAISELRSEGWKDWHLLMAISNLVINFRIAKSGSDISDPAVRERFMRLEPEDPCEEEIDPAMITTDALRMQLLFSAGATADALGLEPSGALSPEEIQHVLATRYSYWQDDAPHDDPFSVQ